jgi:hypothetical protein
MCRERNQCVTDCKGARCSLYLDGTVNVRFKAKAVHPALVGFGCPHDPRTIPDECSPRRCQYLQPQQSRNNEQLSHAVSLASHAYRAARSILATFNFNVLTAPALFLHSRAAVQGQLLTGPASSGSRCASLTRTATHNEAQPSTPSLLVSWFQPVSRHPQALLLSSCSFFSSLVPLKIQFVMLARTMCVYGNSVGQVAGLRSGRRQLPVLEVENIRSRTSPAPLSANETLGAFKVPCPPALAIASCGGMMAGQTGILSTLLLRPLRLGP